MKTISFDSITVDGDKVTITGTISQKEFTGRTQQVSISDFPAENPAWTRNIQLSNQAVFVKRYGCESFALQNQELSKLAVAIETTLAAPPMPEKKEIKVTLPEPKPAEPVPAQ